MRPSPAFRRVPRPVAGTPKGSREEVRPGWKRGSDPDPLPSHPKPHKGSRDPPFLPFGKRTPVLSSESLTRFSKISGFKASPRRVMIQIENSYPLPSSSCVPVFWEGAFSVISSGRPSRVLREPSRQ